jgi:LPXTG-motif cell wall-anchored protein
MKARSSVSVLGAVQTAPQSTLVMARTSLASKGINGESILSLTATIMGGSAPSLQQVRLSAVPGPIAGAGLPALMALGGFVWARRRKAAATA